MNILLLAAGFGTRLKEFGKTTPKGLIAQGAKTLLGHVVDDVCDFSQKSPIALVTNDIFFEKYSTWVQKNYAEKEIHILNDGAREPDKRLGALGDIVFSLDTLSWWNDDLLILPSDTYYQFSLEQFVEFAKKNSGFATVVRDMHDKQIIAGRLGCAIIKNDQIVEFVEKPVEPPSTLAAIPFYYYPKEVLAMFSAYQKEGGNMDAPGSIIPWFLKKNIPVFAFVTEGKTLDVGTTDDINKLQSIS